MPDEHTAHPADQQVALPGRLDLRVIFESAPLAKGFESHIRIPDGTLEDRVISAEKTERVGHLKIGFDSRRLGPADPQARYGDPLTSVRRIESKSRK